MTPAASMSVVFVQMDARTLREARFQPKFGNPNDRVET
jgi:hypothetical protein